MKLANLATLTAAFLAAGSDSTLGASPWQMHDWMGWGGGGMWIGPLFMIALLGLLVAGIVALVRWIGGSNGNGRVRTAREILDERYARGEINPEEYQRRRDDIAGRA